MKISYKKTVYCALVFGWISLFWGSYDAILQSIDYDVFGLNPVWHGLIIAADNILGLFLLPLFGRLSDKSNSRFGKRKPFIVIGTIISMIGFSGVCLFASLGKDYFIPFLICLIITLSAMAGYRSPGLALVPDINIDNNRSKANAVSNIMSVILTVVAMLFFFIFMRFKGYYAIGASIIVTTLIMLFVFCIKVKENKFRNDMFVANDIATLEQEKQDKINKENNELVCPYEDEFNKSLAYSESHAIEIINCNEDALLNLPSIDSALYRGFLKKRIKPYKVIDKNNKENKKTKLRDKVWFNKFCILAIVFCFYMAYNALTSNFIKYAEYILGLKQNDAIVPLILAQIAAIIAFPAASLMASKWGRKNTILLGFLIMVGAFGFTVYFTSPSPALYVLFCILGISFGLVMVNIYPYFLELSADNEIGQNTGFFAVSMTVAMVITPMLSGYLITIADGWFGGTQNAGFRVLFPYSIVFLVLATILTFIIKNNKDAENTKKGLEVFDVD